MDEIQTDIEQRLAGLDPKIELIALERPAQSTLRLFIDHPGGVDLGLCERVNKALTELSSDYALEVSSPGLDRPLTKPEHFRRFIGRKARLRTREAIEGRRNFTGLIIEADEDVVRVEDSGRRFEIPLEQLNRSNLVPEPLEVHP